MSLLSAITGGAAASGGVKQIKHFKFSGSSHTHWSARAASSLTNAGTTATFVSALTHGRLVGDPITMSGATGAP